MMLRKVPKRHGAAQERRKTTIIPATVSEARARPVRLWRASTMAAGGACWDDEPATTDWPNRLAANQTKATKGKPTA